VPSHVLGWLVVEYGATPRWKMLHYHVKDAFAPVGINAFVDADNAITIGYSRCCNNACMHAYA